MVAYYDGSRFVRSVDADEDAAYAIAHKFCELLGITEFSVLVHMDDGTIEIEDMGHATVSAHRIAWAGDQVGAEVLVSFNSQVAEFRLKEKA